ncbi:hypothetical protein [Paenibacillus medicaginis]|uniref:DNA-binding protein n=1 Tax=Paenibacillus medicaginis TaxID=1470560 RepID=A0ABV5C7F2_9BACL
MDDLHLDGLKIDSLVDLLKAAYTLEDYDHMIEIADKLLISAERVYSKQKQSMDSGKRYVKVDGKRHIVYYFGFSQMAKGIALQKKEKYEESLACIKGYADLSWLHDETVEADEEISAFKRFATSNTYSVNLLAGKQKWVYIEDFVFHLKNSKKEDLISGLVVVLDHALKYNVNVNSILAQFHEVMKNIITEGKYLNAKRMYLTKYFHRMALYLLREGNYKDALNYTLKTLEESDKFNDMVNYKRSTALFEEHRNYASKEQLHDYLRIIKGGIEDEKSIDYGSVSNGGFKFYHSASF